MGNCNWSMVSSPIDVTKPVYIGHYNGISISMDGGNKWQDIEVGYSFIWVYALTIDPTNPQTIYAGTENEGAFKSINGGTIWDTVNCGLNDWSIYSFAIDPAAPGTIYAGSLGVVKSTDRGSSWTQLSMNDYPVYSLAIDPSASQTIYAGTSNGIYQSVNGGVDWTASNLGTTSPFLSIAALAIDPLSTNTIYAAANYGINTGVYKSMDGGNNWSQCGLTKNDIYILVIDPSTPQTIYAGTHDAGILKSTNGGNAWNPINNGLTDTYIESVAIDPKAPQTVYAGTLTGGIFKSTNGGIDWKFLAKSGSILALDPSDSQTIYADDPFRGLIRSKDAGITWDLLDSGLLNKAIISLAIDPTARQMPYIGTQGSGVWVYSLDQDLDLGKGGTVKSSTGIGGAEIQTGVAELIVNSGSIPYGTVVISLMQNGVTISETGIPSAPPTTKARIFVDYRSKVTAMPGQS